jgi:hypothetical protein
VTYPASGGTIYPTARQGDLYYKQLSVTNGSAAQYPSFKITGVKNNAGPNGEDAVTEITKSAFVAQTPEAFSYDTDGNLTNDARFHYTWDGENRLIAIETQTGTVTPSGPLPVSERKRLEFSYDGQSRRTTKKVYHWDTSSSAWVLDSSLLFVYDAWNMIAELDALNSNAVARTYVWGSDLSGSMQGAGGVGGLLSFTDAVSGGTHFASYGI